MLAGEGQQVVKQVGQLRGFCPIGPKFHEFMSAEAAGEAATEAEAVWHCVQH